MAVITRFFALFIFLTLTGRTFADNYELHNKYTHDYNTKRLENAIGSHYTDINKSKKGNISIDMLEEAENDTEISISLFKHSFFFVYLLFLSSFGILIPHYNALNNLKKADNSLFVVLHNIRI